MMPSIKQLKYFTVVAQLGHISNAAEHLHISQSSITTAIKQLEEIVNTNLFERHAKGVRLTYEGHRFYEQAKQILHSLDDAILSIQKEYKNLAGSIKIAISYTVFGYFLSSVLHRFNQYYANINIDIVEHTRQDIEQQIINDQCDLALVLISNITNNNLLSSSSLWRSKRRLWLPHNHKFLFEKKITFKEISQEPYIMFTADEAELTTIKYWSRSNYQPNIKYRTSSVEAVRTMIASGIGLTILSDMVFRKWSLDGKRIEVMEVAETIPTMDIGIVWKKGKTLNAMEHAFIKYMQTTVIKEALIESQNQPPFRAEPIF